MEAPLHQLPPMQQQAMFAHPPSCKHDATATMAATDMACLQQQQQLMQPAAVPNPNTPSGAREQCPRCASHDTKFCYYNNYNTSQPRHFCRACRRYWTLGGSLRNVPIGGSTRKRLRPAPQQGFRRPAIHFGAPPPPPMPAPQAQPHSQQSQHTGGLLGSLFALGGAPLLEGRVGFDLGLGLSGLGQVGLAGDFGLHSLGLRGSGHAAAGGTSSGPLLWPAGFFDNGNVDTWKLSGGGAGAISMWAPEFSSAPTAAQVGGMFHGGAQIM
uniref:Uncharacterized protein n=1 Tax=Avena sativa TaxID=4498 RepID=A0ACD6A3C5_AVESA